MGQRPPTLAVTVLKTSKRRRRNGTKFSKNVTRFSKNVTVFPLNRGNRVLILSFLRLWVSSLKGLSTQTVFGEPDKNASQTGGMYYYFGPAGPSTEAGTGGPQGGEESTALVTVLSGYHNLPVAVSV